MIRIEKRALREEAFRRPLRHYPRARDAFRALLLRVGVPERGGVLLPAYVGWSPREGSGVFDPIRELNAAVSFYRVDRSLYIDIKDVRDQLRRKRPRVLVLIHYFGYPDPAFREAVTLAHETDAVVVEDEAHAMLSDLVGGICGRDGAATLYSLHKLLPRASGGVLVVNDTQACGGMDETDSASDARHAEGAEAYDLVSIAEARLRNARALTRELERLQKFLELLRPELPNGVVPQTLPVVLKRAPRDEVYHLMNDAGFGVVSLYHTMIGEITVDSYPESHWLAKRILNLPVHQDASVDALREMVEHFERILRSWG